MKLFAKQFDRFDDPSFYFQAKTLPAECVGNNDSGWQIKAEIKEDWFIWVNYFEAFHPDYGIVFGDFEDEVFASNQEAFEHFVKHHPFEDWDYGDI